MNVGDNWYLDRVANFQIDFPGEGFLLLSLLVEKGRHGHLHVQLQTVGLAHQVVNHGFGQDLGMAFGFAEIKTKLGKDSKGRIELKIFI